MKLIGISFPALIFVSLLTSCKRDPEHRVRINNQFPDTIVDTKIGPALFGTVLPNSETEYKEVVNGHNPLSGTFAITDSILTGTISINGNDAHNYTLKIDAAGKKTLKEDK